MSDRTLKVLLVFVAVPLWGLLLRPLFTASPAQAQQRSLTAPPSPQNTPENREIVGDVAHNPTAVVINDAIYVIGDGYITRYMTNGGNSLSQTHSEKLPSRKVFRVPPPSTGTGGGGFGSGGFGK